MEDEKVVLRHQMEEWKCLNDYINKMDTGYQKVIVIISSIVTGILFVIMNSQSEDFYKISLLIPPGITTIMTYVAYQFRITAILRGHLASLERKMNKTLNNNVYMWNSALVESYMAHNNMINSLMVLPMAVLIIIIMIFCAYYTHIVLADCLIVFIIYWIIIAVFSVIYVLSFLNNEKVRKETEEEEKVLQLYRYYLKNRRGYFVDTSILKNFDSNYQNSEKLNDIKQEILIDMYEKHLDLLSIDELIALENAIKKRRGKD